MAFSYPLGYQIFGYSFYLTDNFSLVDIAGYFPFFATFRVTVHEAEALGATNFDPTMEHGPDSLQVFFPVDTEERSPVRVVFELFFTDDFFTVKPGRAINFKAAAAT